MTWLKRQVVMLPTNEKSSIRMYPTGKLFLTNLGDFHEKCKNQHLYFLSDEEIKEGDWFYYKHFGEDIIDQTKETTDLVNLNKPDRYFKKIIATTDRELRNGGQTCKLPYPSQSFIEKFVEEYNKGNVIKEVMVEYFNNVPAISNEEYEALEKEKISYKDTKPFYIDVLKVNPKDNTITIRKVKDSWNREEMESKMRESFRAGFDYANAKSSFAYDEDKWIQENL